ncbi:hypothetical protein T484DRAFT_1961696 [Baffinella frigidus]|nr:hypothetical protein T484DRAFT_1961696 [Cryptophyta sp. CCMP2293]
MSMRAAQAHGRRSAHSERIPGKIGALEAPYHGAHDGARGASGRPAGCAPRPRCTKDPRRLSEIRFFSLGFPPQRGRRRGFEGATPTAPPPLLAIRRRRAAERAPSADAGPLEQKL